MNKLTISNLILLILNKDNTNILRNEALKELKKRAFDYGLNYEDLIKMDGDNIFKRGFNTKDYLFSKNIDMQKLMNTYFKNIYSDDNKLLLSEKELCNNSGSFFNTINVKELKNINKRLKNNNLSINDKQRLLKVKEILEDRYNNKKQTFISNNDMYIMLKSLDYDFDCEELIKDKFFSNIELMRRSLLGSLKDKELIKYLYISNIIRQESRKLKEQKRKLLSQVKNEYKVDYQTKEIDNALTYRRHKL